MLKERFRSHRGMNRAINMDSSSPISVVIPTLNAEDTLGAAIASVGGQVLEVIVVDGGSSDGTERIAEAESARLVTSERGRGEQLSAGGAAAASDWLLFLHADTRLSADWQNEAAHFIGDPANAGRAAVFTFALDDPSPQARRLERIVAWRTRRLGLPYGDQALLISRQFYDRLGGFRPMPLMEDVDIVRRIGRRNLAVLKASAVTSSARYRRGGWWARPARNIICLTLYFLGVPPRMLARIYR